MIEEWNPACYLVKDLGDLEGARDARRHCDTVDGLVIGEVCVGKNKRKKEKGRLQGGAPLDLWLNS